MKVSYKVAFHLVLFILTCWGLQALVYSGIKKVKTEDFGVWNKIEKGEINSEIVFAGSSRCWLHFAPEEITKITGRSCYNIGMDGSTPNLQLPRLNLFLDKNRGCKILFQEVSLMHLQILTEIYNRKQYLPYLNETSIFEPVIALDKELYFCKYLPLYGIIQQNQYYREEALKGWVQYFSGNYSDTYQHGFYPMNLEWDGKADEFKKSHKNGTIFPVQPKAIAVLQNMISTIKKQDIEVILIFAPEYEGIRPYIKNRAQIMNIFKELAKSNNIQFWDYSNHPMCKQKDNFYNSEHLKGSAAIEFSKSFAYDLKAYLDSKHIVLK